MTTSHANFNLPVISGADLVGQKIEPPTPAILKRRAELLNIMAADCARCGDTVDGIYSFLKFQRREMGLNIPDAALSQLAKNAFEAWWARPENKVQGGLLDFVLGPRPGRKIGLFPLGAVSAFQGASGSGKSTIAFPFLINQRNRLPVFGRETYGREFRVVMLDRTRDAFLRTLLSIGLTEDELPHDVLSDEQERQEPADVLADIWSQHQGTQIFFIEGLDLWCKSINDMTVVQRMLAPIQKFAERTHTAVIASIGAPKMKAGEGYESPRDRAIGSTAWARKLDSVLDVVEDQNTHVRHVSLISRNDAVQTVRLHFSEGKGFVEPPIQVVIDATPVGPSRAKLAREMAANGSTQAEIAEEMRVSERTVRRWLDRT